MNINENKLRTEEKCGVIKTFSLTLMTIICSYIMLALPVASAVSISIYDDPDGNELYGTTPLTVTINPEDYVDVDIEVTYDAELSDNLITVDISEMTGAEINHVYSYRCISRNVKECLETHAATGYSSDADPDSPLWASFSDSWATKDQYPGLYTRTENLFTLVVVSIDGTQTIVGFWDELYRETTASIKHFKYKLDGLDLYLKPGFLASDIGDYITEHKTIPITYVSSATFKTFKDSKLSDGTSYITQKFYEATFDTVPGDYGEDSGNEVKQMAGNKLTAEEIESIDKNNLLTFVEQYTDDPGKPWLKIASPVLFESVDIGMCGNGNVDIGETLSNCCVDYYSAGEGQCQSGYYCDTDTNTCVNENIKMTLESEELGLGNCNAQTKDMTIFITKAGGLAIDSASFKTEYMADPSSMACQQMGTIGNTIEFECSLNLPQIPAEKCIKDTYFLENQIEVNINFNDGNIVEQKSFEEEFRIKLMADCTIYDCPDGQYCDMYDAQNPECRKDLDESDIGIENMQPLSFNAYMPGDKVTFLAKIGRLDGSKTKPGGLEFNTQQSECIVDSCPGCPNSDAVECYVSCDEPDTQEHESYNEYNCEITFDGIPGFNELLDNYEINIKITFPITYDDADSQRQLTLNKLLPTIRVNRYICGNTEPDPGESDFIPELNSVRCCYDTACTLPNQYCDFKTGNEADCLCRFKNELGASLTEVQPLPNGPILEKTNGIWSGDILFKENAFSEPHSTKFNVELDNKPVGINSIDVGCKTGTHTAGGTEIPCEIRNCNIAGVLDGESNLECELFIKTLESVSGFEAEDKLTLSLIEIEGTIKYNDAANGVPSTLEIDYQERFPVIIYSSKGLCGNGACETGTGENVNNCCQDCYNYDPDTGEIIHNYESGYQYCQAESGSGSWCPATGGGCQELDCGNSVCQDPPEAREGHDSFCCIDCKYLNDEDLCVSNHDDSWYCQEEKLSDFYGKCQQSFCNNQKAEPPEEFGSRDNTEEPDEQFDCCLDTNDCPSGYFCPSIDEFVGGGPFPCRELACPDEYHLESEGPGEPYQCCINNFEGSGEVCPERTSCQNYNNIRDDYGECIQPNCGDGYCAEEAGETIDTCCTDCGLWLDPPVSCPAGNYCNIENPEWGCVINSCGQGVGYDPELPGERCGPNENYENCCQDCVCPEEEPFCTNNGCSADRPYLRKINIGEIGTFGGVFIQCHLTDKKDEAIINQGCKLQNDPFIKLEIKNAHPLLEKEIPKTGWKAYFSTDPSELVSDSIDAEKEVDVSCQKSRGTELHQYDCTVLLKDKPILDDELSGAKPHSKGEETGYVVFEASGYADGEPVTIASSKIQTGMIKFKIQKKYEPINSKAGQDKEGDKFISSIQRLIQYIAWAIAILSIIRIWACGGIGLGFSEDEPTELLTEDIISFAGAEAMKQAVKSKTPAKPKICWVDAIILLLTKLMATLVNTVAAFEYLENTDPKDLNPEIVKTFLPSFEKDTTTITDKKDSSTSTYTVTVTGGSYEGTSIHGYKVGGDDHYCPGNTVEIILDLCYFYADTEWKLYFKDSPSDILKFGKLVEGQDCVIEMELSYERVFGTPLVEGDKKERTISLNIWEEDFNELESFTLYGHSVNDCENVIGKKCTYDNEDTVCGDFEYCNTLSGHCEKCKQTLGSAHQCGMMENNIPWYNTGCVGDFCSHCFCDESEGTRIRGEETETQGGGTGDTKDYLSLVITNRNGITTTIPPSSLSGYGVCENDRELKFDWSSHPHPETCALHIDTEDNWIYIQRCPAGSSSCENTPQHFFDGATLKWYGIKLVCDNQHLREISLFYYPSSHEKCGGGTGGLTAGEDFVEITIASEIFSDGIVFALPGILNNNLDPCDLFPGDKVKAYAYSCVESPFLSGCFYKIDLKDLSGIKPYNDYNKDYSFLCNSPYNVEVGMYEFGWITSVFNFPHIDEWVNTAEGSRLVREFLPEEIDPAPSYDYSKKENIVIGTENTGDHLQLEVDDDEENSQTGIVFTEKSWESFQVCKNNDYDQLDAYCIIKSFWDLGWAENYDDAYDICESCSVWLNEGSSGYRKINNGILPIMHTEIQDKNPVDSWNPDGSWFPEDAPTGEYEIQLRCAAFDLPPVTLELLPSSDPICGETGSECNCYNQNCLGTNDFCADGEGNILDGCTTITCQSDSDCSGIGTCDDPSKAERVFKCNAEDKCYGEVI